MIYFYYILVPTRVFLEEECRGYANSEGFSFNWKKDTYTGSKNVSFIPDTVNCHV
jgi:hypothetical protein